MKSKPQKVKSPRRWSEASLNTSLHGDASAGSMELSKQGQVAETNQLYTISIKSHKSIALVSLKHCEFANLLVGCPSKKTKMRYQDRITVPPLTAWTRKACLDGNELVPGYLSGKVGDL